MKSHWYIVAIFFIVGYLPTVIGLLTAILLTIILRLYNNRSLLLVSYLFLFYSIYSSPNPFQITTIEDEVFYNGQVFIKSDIKDKSNYSEFIGQINDDFLVLFRINDAQKLNTLKYGAKCRINANLKLPREPTNEGQFNYKHYLFSKGIFYVANEVEIIKCNGKSLLSRGHDIRNDLLEKAKNALSHESYQWVKALIFGDRSEIDEEIIELFQFWNISHLLAISGLHVTFTLAIFYFLFQRIFNLTKEMTTTLLLIIIPFYIIIAGANPPVIRAGFMTAIVLLWRLFNKRINSVDVISIVCIVLLLNNPYLLYDLSFQFSFAVTFALILSTNLFKNQHWLVLSIRISIISQLAILPLQFHYFYYTNVFSFLANLFFVPYFTAFVIPLCLLMILTLPFQFLTNIFDYVFILIHERVLIILEWIGKLDFTVWVFGKPSFMSIILFYLFFIFFMKCWDKNKLKQASIFAILSITVFIVEGLLPYFDPTYSITMLDVGQSESIVVELPYRKGIFMIDAGEEMNFYEDELQHRNFNNVIKPYLWSKGIAKIDALFISHFDLDHSGSAEKVVETFKPKYVFTHPFIEHDQSKIIKLSQGMKIQINGANIEVLSPKLNDKYINENDSSLVLLFEVNDFLTLFTGDISKQIEERIVQEKLLPQIDLLKVAHHGSQTSTSEILVNKLKPKYAMISLGENNIYQHPHQEVIDTLDKNNVYIFRTDLHGQISIKLKNDQIKIKTYKHY